MFRPRHALHPAAPGLAREVAAGTLSRREFLSRATALGVGAPAAYALIGTPRPAAGQTAARRPGGTLRIQQDVRPLKDPRTFDWPQMSNFARGWLEWLVEYTREGTFEPRLLADWEVSDDASEYVLHLRRGVQWNDGTPFTARDVAYNFTRWCDSTVEGNSMATRLQGLIDPETGKARDGAIIVEDEHTVRLRLSEPDISIIATAADFTAAIVQDGFKGNPLDNPVGTGPYLPGEYQIGVKGVLERNRDHAWWGSEVLGEPTLERIEYLDLGTDQAAFAAAFEGDEIDMTYETVGEFIEVLDALGLERSETVTARTVVIRPNQAAEVGGARPYADRRVRRALAMAVNNRVCLELGYSGRGQVAENHHVCPVHPEYADIGPAGYDPDAARALMAEAGMAEFEHDLVSIDDSWRKQTADSVAAQLRDAGIAVKRTVLPGSTFWNGWANYPFSTTDWGHRPLGVQVLALAYRSGAQWNESGFANAEFDSLLDEALRLPDADRRREVMARIETILREEGAIIQPYWTSVFRHLRADVVGAEAHPAFEIYPYRLGFAA